MLMILFSVYAILVFLSIDPAFLTRFLIKGDYNFTLDHSVYEI